LIEIQAPTERAFLVGAPRKGSADAVHADEHLDELARLADTAGAVVIGRTSQRVEAPTPNTYIGQGKVEELAGLVRAAGATLVLFDEPLAPVQGTNLEKALDVRVMDRSEVILDIFATRARSAEAKLEVELAQLEYLLPRLTRMWTHLSRIRGGIGLRGPGETQLETDRRRIRRRISALKRRLEHVAEHRANQRHGRRDLPSAALVGYTNAGKSSVLRALSGEDVFVEDRLFATLDTLAREVDVGDNYHFRITDTVGFIRKLPHHLVASFRATLEEAREADLLLHVIDAAHPAWEEQVQVVEAVLADMGLYGGERGKGKGERRHNGERGMGKGERETPALERKRTIHVFNKADLLPDPDALLAQVRERYPHAVLASARETRKGKEDRESVPSPTFPHSPFPFPHSPFPFPRGVDGLRAVLRTSARALRPVARIRVPVGEGKLLAELHRRGEVLGREQMDGVLVVTARVEARLLGQLRRDGVAVDIAP
jgi:GTP-binding protein HflX